MPVLTAVARNAQTGEPIPSFKYLVNENNVGNPLDPDPSKWPSLRPPASNSPVVAAGDSSNPSTSVPPGDYLVTVRAPGYKLGGNWASVPDDGTITVTVDLQPHPLPLSRIRVHVFHDNHPVNGEDDQPLEFGLPGFRIVIEDAVGEVTTDYFGNAIGTQYEKDSEGHYIIGPDGRPIPIPDTGGNIWTDPDGNALIENLAPGKYGVQAVPPDGTGWIQTTTIEGTKVIDAWIEEGSTGYLTEEGFPAPLVWIGFVRPMEFPVPGPAGTVGTITVQVRTIVEFETTLRQEPNPPLAMGDPVDRPWVALTDIGSNDQQVYTGRGDRYGRITIPNVPAGLYQLAVWDDPLDYIISFRTVQVPDPRTGAWHVTLSDDPVNYPGQVAIPRWFGWIRGKVFRDADANTLFETDPAVPDEGIPDVEVLTRFKDGSIQYSTLANKNGDYSFNEVFELEHFTVAEVGFTRYGRLAAIATPEYEHPLQRPTNVYEGVLTLTTLTWANSKNLILWSKKEYPLPGPDGDGGSGGVVTNGGISGIVHYATMRNELDPRYAVAEDYEPGVPAVTVNLYEGVPDPETGRYSKGARINSVTTDAWQHPTTPDGNPVLEIPGVGNYIAGGVFDGGYAFADRWVLDGAGNPLVDPQDPNDRLTESLPEGTYVVEVEVPEGYRILDESSVNTGDGDVYEPAPPETGPLAVPQPGRSDAAGEVSVMIAPPPYVDGCRTEKVVRLETGQNATCDFFIYTEVPIPGRILGLLIDDLNVETDPAKIRYGDKRGVPLTPVGIRDFTGRLLATVLSDDNGIFEILLPSTYTANIPSPSGIAPGMYRVIGNDPGDPDAPNPTYNPDYHTLPLVFDVWPGKTTYADVALVPISAFLLNARAEFTRPPDCGLPQDVPVITEVNQVYFDDTTSRGLVISGRGFGRRRGSATLAGRELPIRYWCPNAIWCRVPRSMPPGAWQLSVRSWTGEASVFGLTIHVLGPGYEPEVRVVPPGDSIQDAIDAAPEKSLIVVSPGTYYESPILYKNLKLQGHGAEATIIDGRFFQHYRRTWLGTLRGVSFDGPENVPEGQAITVLARQGLFGDGFKTQIDGFTVSGARGQVGGGVHVHAFCRYLEIGNCVFENNGGGFGGAITIGRPYSGDCHNEHVRVYRNRITGNGGTSLAGAIGIFNGAHHYELDHNLICGNYSGEYGGGVSHLGLSRFGEIHHNTVSYNSSFDEGGGILVGGEQPVPPEEVSKGSGEVRIYNNNVHGNVANDDGGGIRLLRAGTHRIHVYNNMVANNVSADVGGGIALDDSSDVVIINNTIAKNITTATAEDSDRLPHGAGLASEGNSAPFQATLPPGAALFSDPVLINNLFWDNRAHWFDAGTGRLSTEFRRIDLEVVGTTTPWTMTPSYCYLTVPYGSGAGNLVYDRTNPPRFARANDTVVNVATFAGEPDFKTLKIVVTPQPPGDYHIRGSSPCRGRGVQLLAAKGTVWTAPPYDFDDERRPYGRVDIGADEYRPGRR
ncbi:MAG: pectin esterase [Bacillota bacterium]|nr:MAG: pectin esterase [Bacillota bacterium]